VSQVNVLVIDDDQATCKLLTDVLESKGYSVRSAAGGPEALQVVKSDPVNVVLTDLKMPAMNGFEVLAAMREVNPEIVVIIMTGFGSIATAVEAMKRGANNYVTKPFNLEELLLVLEKELEGKALREENRQLRQEIEGRYRFSNILSRSKNMQEVFTLISRVSQSRSTVLIYGASGTGKELVARAIHHNSPHKDRPFVAINCSAIPETLMESELFGHVKGAFTGAYCNKPGLFEEARSGTLFMDEIGSIPLSMQAKLLRAIQEREIKRVGGTDTIKVDVHLITATNEDLTEKVKRGEFREDLFYRLHVIPIVLPPLRERREDIPLLVDHFLKIYSRVAGKTIPRVEREAMNFLLNYNWPGNVRELENAIERAVALGEGEVITPLDLPERISKHSPERLVRVAAAEHLTLEKLQDAYIARVLEETGGNKTKAAHILGVHPRTLTRRKMSRNGSSFTAVPIQAENK